MPKSNAMMLPANITPIKYQLTLEPNLDRFNFQGTETVEIEVLEPTSTITLNSIEIAIRTCGLTLSDGSVMTPYDTVLDDSDETATFKFDSTIPPGPAQLNIKFTGGLNDKLRGFYRSRYKGLDGGEQYMATTQLEATDARRAFPCWDEPGLKATFDVTIIVPSNLVALSNMPMLSETEVRPGYNAVHFDETPIMSTYLLAFVVGDLVAVEQQCDDGTLMRVWTPRGREEQGLFALETSVKLLAYFNDYFSIP